MLYISIRKTCLHLAWHLIVCADITVYFIFFVAGSNHPTSNERIFNNHLSSTIVVPLASLSLCVQDQRIDQFHNYHCWSSQWGTKHSFFPGSEAFSSAWYGEQGVLNTEFRQCTARTPNFGIVLTLTHSHMQASLTKFEAARI